MNLKALSIVVVLSICMIASILILIICIRSINSSVNLPLETKLLLAEIQKAKDAGHFTKSDLPIRCIKQKLNVTRMAIDNEIDEKASEIQLARAKAAYEIATYPCLKLRDSFDEFNRTRKVADERNETYVECIRDELENLKSDSKVLTFFNQTAEKIKIDPDNCQKIIDVQVEPQKEIFENFFTSSKLQKCTKEEFLQLDSLRVKIFEEFLALTVKMENQKDYEEFKKKYAENVEAMASKQLKCVLRELY